MGGSEGSFPEPEFPASELRASDADRDAAAEKLAEAVAAGRLSLADHEARLTALFTARTTGEIAAVTADLPALPVRRSGMYRVVDAHQVTVVGGTVQRTGRFPVGRFCTVTAVFGQVDLDLRAATPSQREIDLTIRGIASRVSVTVPRWWGLTDQVFVIGMSHAVPTQEETDAHAPLLRLRGACLGGSFRLTQA
jgi:hypothetical protein